MKAKRLTDASVERIPASPKREEYPDTIQPGLRLIVFPSGAKSWAVRSRVDGKPFKYTIGGYPTYSLSEAREKAREALQSAAKGVAPLEAAQEEKAAQEAAKRRAQDASKHTVRALCEVYVTYLEGRDKKAAAKHAQSMFKCHVYPREALASKPAREATTRDFVAVIRGVHEAGKQRAAGILRSYLGAAYSAGLRAPLDMTMPEGFLVFDIQTNPIDPIPTVPVNAGKRSLSWSELGVYYRCLPEDPDITSDALQLSLLAGGQRIAQVLRAEIGDYETESKVLTLRDPKGRRSTPRDHLVPLGPKAAEIVERLIQRAKEKKTRKLFTSDVGEMLVDEGTPGERVSHISEAMSLCSSLGSERFNVRDIRRTVETLLASMGVHKDHRAHLQSHGLGGVQNQHYDKWDYIDEKRAVLLTWEKKLEALLQGENPDARKVVPIRGRA